MGGGVALLGRGRAGPWPAAVPGGNAGWPAAADASGAASVLVLLPQPATTAQTATIITTMTKTATTLPMCMRTGRHLPLPQTGCVSSGDCRETDIFDGAGRSARQAFARKCFLFDAANQGKGNFCKNRLWLPGRTVKKVSEAKEVVVDYCLASLSAAAGGKCNAAVSRPQTNGCVRTGHRTPYHAKGCKTPPRQT